jgi:hypothetical protein
MLQDLPLQPPGRGKSMAFQMYMVAFKGDFSDVVSRSVQQRVRQSNGVTLMVMKTGIIAAFDDALVPAIQSHPDVKLVGGVTLNPQGFAAERLQRIFAENLSKQIEVGHESGPAK